MTAKLLSEARQRSGMTLEEAASQMQCSPEALRSFEDGSQLANPKFAGGFFSVYPDAELVISEAYIAEMLAVLAPIFGDDTGPHPNDYERYGAESCQDDWEEDR